MSTKNLCTLIHIKNICIIISVCDQCAVISCKNQHSCCPSSDDNCSCIVCCLTHNSQISLHFTTDKPL